MSGDVHVRIRERVGVRFPRATRPVICCQYERDAQRIVKAMKGRLAKYHLTLNAEKTRLVPFSIPVHHQGDKPGMFEFLGFTFYWGQSRQGTPIPKVKTSGRRLRGKLKRVNYWARSVRNRYPLKLIWARFRAKIEGHNRYYGVSFNRKALRTFSQQARRILFKHLSRRSQRSHSRGSSLCASRKSIRSRR
jgi:hypothetical protein